MTSTHTRRETSTTYITFLIRCQGNNICTKIASKFGKNVKLCTPQEGETYDLKQVGTKKNSSHLSEHRTSPTWWAESNNKWKIKKREKKLEKQRNTTTLFKIPVTEATVYHTLTDDEKLILIKSSSFAITLRTVPKKEIITISKITKIRQNVAHILVVINTNNTLKKTTNIHEDDCYKLSARDPRTYLEVTRKSRMKPVHLAEHIEQKTIPRGETSRSLKLYELPWPLVGAIKSLTQRSKKNLECIM